MCCPSCGADPAAREYRAYQTGEAAGVVGEVSHLKPSRNLYVLIYLTVSVLSVAWNLEASQGIHKLHRLWPRQSPHHVVAAEVGVQLPWGDPFCQIDCALPLT